MVAPDYTSRAVRALLGASAHPGGPASTRRLVRHLQLPAAARVTDVACGSGTTAVLLAWGGARVDGVDVEAAAIQRARRAAARAGITERCRFQVGDAHALPLRTAAYDGVLCECSLSTFADPALAARELVRLLRPGGRLGVSDVTADRERLGRAYPRVLALVDGLTTARPLDAYAELLEQAGAHILETADCSADALALARRIRRRLEVVAPLSARLRAGARLAGEAAQAVEEGLLGYGVLVAESRLSWSGTSPAGS